MGIFRVTIFAPRRVEVLHVQKRGDPASTTTMITSTAAGGGGGGNVTGAGAPTTPPAAIGVTTVGSAPFASITSPTGAQQQPQAVPPAASTAAPSSSAAGSSGGKTLAQSPSTGSVGTAGAPSFPNTTNVSFSAPLSGGSSPPITPSTCPTGAGGSSGGGGGVVVGVLLPPLIALPTSPSQPPPEAAAAAAGGVTPAPVGETVAASGATTTVSNGVIILGSGGGGGGGGGADSEVIAKVIKERKGGAENVYDVTFRAQRIKREDIVLAEAAAGQNVATAAAIAVTAATAAATAAVSVVSPATPAHQLLLSLQQGTAASSNSLLSPERGGQLTSPPNAVGKKENIASSGNPNANNTAGTLPLIPPLTAPPTASPSSVSTGINGSANTTSSPAAAAAKAAATQAALDVLGRSCLTPTCAAAATATLVAATENNCANTNLNMNGALNTNNNSSNLNNSSDPFRSIHSGTGTGGGTSNQLTSFTGGAGLAGLLNTQSSLDVLSSSRSHRSNGPSVGGGDGGGATPPMPQRQLSTTTAVSTSQPITPATATLKAPAKKTFAQAIVQHEAVAAKKEKEQQQLLLNKEQQQQQIQQQLRSQSSQQAIVVVPSGERPAGHRMCSPPLRLELEGGFSPSVLSATTAATNTASNTSSSANGPASKADPTAPMGSVSGNATPMPATITVDHTAAGAGSILPPQPSLSLLSPTGTAAAATTPSVATTATVTASGDPSMPIIIHTPLSQSTNNRNITTAATAGGPTLALASVTSPPAGRSSVLTADGNPSNERVEDEEEAAGPHLSDVLRSRSINNNDADDAASSGNTNNNGDDGDDDTPHAPPPRYRRDTEDDMAGDEPYRPVPLANTAAGARDDEVDDFLEKVDADPSTTNNNKMTIQPGTTTNASSPQTVVSPPAPKKAVSTVTPQNLAALPAAEAAPQLMPLSSHALSAINNANNSNGIGGGGGMTGNNTASLSHNITNTSFGMMTATTNNASITATVGSGAGGGRSFGGGAGGNVLGLAPPAPPSSAAGGGGGLIPDDEEIEVIDVEEQIRALLAVNLPGVRTIWNRVNAIRNVGDFVTDCEVNFVEVSFYAKRRTAMAICHKVITEIGVGRDYGNVAISECDFFRPMIVNSKEALMTKKERLAAAKLARAKEKAAKAAEEIQRQKLLKQQQQQQQAVNNNFSFQLTSPTGAACAGTIGNNTFAVGGDGAFNAADLNHLNDDAAAAAAGGDANDCDNEERNRDLHHSEDDDGPQTDPSVPDEEECDEDEEEEEEDYGTQLEAQIRFDAMLTRISNGVVANFDFLTFLTIASAVSGLGLASDNAVAVLAGSLVSPMMGPILATVMGTVLLIQSTDRTMIGEETAKSKGWRLLLSGVRVELLCLFIALVVGFIIGLAFWGTDDRYFNWGNDGTPQMLSRGRLKTVIVGIFVAIPSGAGVVLSLLGTGGNSLVGAAISSSLLPPVVNSGMYFAFAIRANHKANLRRAGISLCLTCINVVFIFSSALMTFYIKKLGPNYNGSKSSNFDMVDVFNAAERGGEQQQYDDGKEEEEPFAANDGVVDNAPFGSKGGDVEMTSIASPGGRGASGSLRRSSPAAAAGSASTNVLGGSLLAASPTRRNSNNKKRRGLGLGGVHTHQHQQGANLLLADSCLKPFPSIPLFGIGGAIGGGNIDGGGVMGPPDGSPLSFDSVHGGGGGGAMRPPRTPLTARQRRGTRSGAGDYGVIGGGGDGAVALRKSKSAVTSRPSAVEFDLPLDHRSGGGGAGRLPQQSAPRRRNDIGAVPYADDFFFESDDDDNDAEEMGTQRMMTSNGSPATYDGSSPLNASQLQRRRPSYPQTARPHYHQHNATTNDLLSSHQQGSYGGFPTHYHYPSSAVYHPQVHHPQNLYMAPPQFQLQPQQHQPPPRRNIGFSMRASPPSNADDNINSAAADGLMGMKRRRSATARDAKSEHARRSLPSSNVVSPASPAGGGGRSILGRLFFSRGDANHRHSAAGGSPSVHGKRSSSGAPDANQQHGGGYTADELLRQNSNANTINNNTRRGIGEAVVTIPNDCDDDDEEEKDAARRRPQSKVNGSSNSRMWAGLGASPPQTDGNAQNSGSVFAPPPHHRSSPASASSVVFVGDGSINDGSMNLRRRTAGGGGSSASSPHIYHPNKSGGVPVLRLNTSTTNALSGSENRPNGHGLISNKTMSPPIVVMNPVVPPLPLSRQALFDLKRLDKSYRSSDDDDDDLHHQQRQEVEAARRRHTTKTSKNKRKGAPPPPEAVVNVADFFSSDDDDADDGTEDDEGY